MAIKVENKIFFHISRITNYSQYDLLKLGDQLNIGSQNNPFFNYYYTNPLEIYISEE